MPNDKQTMKAAKKSGKTTKRERALVWEYILKGNLTVGYFSAQQLARKGFNVLKPLPYYEDQPN